MRVYQPKRFFKYTLFLMYVGIRLIPFNIYLSVGTLIVALILFLTCGGLVKGIETPFEDSKRYKECIFGKGYFLQEQLQKEKDTRESLYKEQQNAKKRILLGIAIYFPSFALSLFCLLIKAGIPMFIGDIFGYLGEYWGLTLIFNGYVNSDMRGAKTLSRKFCIHSNPVKIDECTKMIHALSDRLQKNEFSG
ncbi:MAG: hypothetical protein IKO41_00090 [Lachnospiraceae bacterium]|nr:hypothetical protein [Lachnospiraceae bacterium]MBR4604613.1 hypothetical protein [Lachnospiraceae bacterium]